MRWLFGSAAASWSPSKPRLERSDVDARAGELPKKASAEVAPHPTRGKLLPPEVLTEREIRALFGACSRARAVGSPGIGTGRCWRSPGGLGFGSPRLPAAEPPQQGGEGELSKTPSTEDRGLDSLRRAHERQAGCSAPAPRAPSEPRPPLDATRPATGFGAPRFGESSPGSGAMT